MEVRRGEYPNDGAMDGSECHISATSCPIIAKLSHICLENECTLFDIFEGLQLKALKAFIYLEGFKLSKTHLKAFRANTA
jgi:hypothetical protein